MSVERRRDFLVGGLSLAAGVGLGFGLGFGAATMMAPAPKPDESVSSSNQPTGLINSFSPAKLKLERGENVIIFVNGDSTSYSQQGPYYKWAVALGELYDCRVVVHRWGEWKIGEPTAIKGYYDPETLREGQGPELTVFIAGLSGGTAGQMFDASRFEQAFMSIPRRDLSILHHGHNMFSFEQPGGLLSIGTGLFMAAVGRTSMVWPDVPQVITTQNPWRDDTGFDKIYEAIRAVAAAHSGLALVDTHAAFISAGKVPGLYSDNVHPSASAGNSSGAQLVADVLLAAWHEAASGISTTPGWPNMPAENYFQAGLFADWIGGLPAGFSVFSGATLVKDTDVTFGHAAYSMALAPNGDENAQCVAHMPDEALAALRGRRVSVAILCRIPASRINCYLSFITPTAGEGETFPLSSLHNCYDNWMWMVASDVSILEAATPANTYFSLLPSFYAEPTSNDPVHIQRIMVTEGAMPRGGLIVES